MPRHFHHALLVLAALALTAPCSAQTPPTYDSLRKEALRLYDEHKLVQALPLLEQLVAQKSDDIVTQERLGFCLLAASAAEDDVEKAKAMRRRARAAMLKAQELGDDSNLLKSVLPTLTEDGSFSDFSQHKEVEDAMRKGEAAFARGEMQQAIDHYTRAFLLDPKLYAAPLFIGDSYYKMKQHGSAQMWYRKAVEIDPNQETAHRYWGDALVESGKIDEARPRFVDAVIAEPYNRRSWIGLSQWADRKEIKLSHPRFQPPTTTGADGKEIPRPLTREDGTEAWAAYDVTRASWREGLFRKKFPKDASYRHSLAEEADALLQVANQVSKNLQSKAVRKLDPDLAVLVELVNSGLLESYVLLARPDEGIAQDYADYREIHREQLAEYINRYVIDHTYGASGPAAGAKRGPSTPEEREKALQLIFMLEQDPLAPQAREARAWLLRWIAEIPDLSVTICADPFTQLLTSKAEHSGEIFMQVMFSTAGWLIEHPDRRDERVAAYLAGVEGSLRAYESLRKRKPNVRWASVDELIQKRDRGTLATDLSALLAKCLAEPGKKLDLQEP